MWNASEATRVFLEWLQFGLFMKARGGNRRGDCPILFERRDYIDWSCID